jgi:hypothetical protein
MLCCVIVWTCMDAYLLDELEQEGVVGGGPLQAEGRGRLERPLPIHQERHLQLLTQREGKCQG